MTSPPPPAGAGDPPSRSGEDKKKLADLAERAARLAKADLVTGMVGEFPELQGLMGGYYAAAQGEHPAVAAAIRDHYKPVGQGDEVPTDPVTVAVSLADKLDTLIGFFLIDQRPTGSKDPFALRRAALGVVALILQNKIRSSTYRLFEQASVDFKSQPDIGLIVARDYFYDFVVDRMKVQQRDAGVRHDIIDAVVMMGGDDDEGGERDLVRLLARVRALQAFVGTENGANLLAGYKRAANILKKEGVVPSGAPANAGAQSNGADGRPGLLPTQQHGVVGETPSYTPEPAEDALRAALDSAEPAAAAAVASEDFERAMAALATLRAPIDAFFESVTVNDADADKRAARLALLDRVRAAVHQVADFSRIEG